MNIEVNSNDFANGGRYHGMNPKFVRQIIAKRRQQAEEELKRRVTDAQKAQQEEVWSEQFLRAIYRIYRDEKREVASASKPLAKDIIRDFAARNGVTYKELVGESRRASLCVLRNAAMYEVRLQRPDMPYTHIGRAFNRNHTSAMYAIGMHCLQNGIEHPMVQMAIRKRGYGKREVLKAIYRQIEKLKKKAALIESGLKQAA